MKILLTSHGKHPTPGGVDTYIRSIMHAMGARGHTVDLLCFSNIDILPDEKLAKLEKIWADLQKTLGGRISKAFIENEFLRHIHQELLEQIDVSSYDIIHSQFGITNIAAKNIRPEIPLVGTIHACFYDEVMQSGWISPEEAEAFRRYDDYAVSCPTTVITVSSFTSKNLPPIPAAEHEIVFNGIDTNLFTPRLHTSNKVRIATSGGFYHHKGYDILMDALSILKEQGHKFEVAMFGSGGEGPATLMSIARERKLPIQFKGEVPREILASELPGFDIFVQPSRLDNFPFSVVEAMACGCVPVGSRVGGIPDQVDHMKNGMLFESENVTELAESLGLLIKDVSLRAKLRENAREKAVEEFSLVKMGERLEEVYQNTIAKHSAQRPSVRSA